MNSRGISDIPPSFPHFNNDLNMRKSAGVVVSPSYGDVSCLRVVLLMSLIHKETCAPAAVGDIYRLMILRLTNLGRII
jgi:hypothetical protein